MRLSTSARRARTGERGNRPVVRGVVDEAGQPFHARLLLFGADHPPTGRSAIPRRLCLEECPRIFVGSKKLLIRGSKFGAFSLLIGVNGGPVFSPPQERLQTCTVDQSQFLERSQTFDVDRAPRAA